jgi:hypothetical protein
MISRFDALKLGKFAIIITAIGIIISLWGCTENKTKKNAPKPVEISDTKVVLKINRFEKDLFSIETFDSSAVVKLRSKYGDFFDIWCLKLAGIVNRSMLVKIDNKVILPTSPELIRNLQDYTHDKYIREVFDEANKKYDNINEIEEGLTNAFSRYQIAFPKNKIPAITTYLSPFYR